MSYPPPFYVFGGTVPNNDNAFISSTPSSSSSSSMQNLNPSIITVILVLSVTVIVSTSLCLLLRYLNRRCRRSSSSNVNDNVTSGVNSQPDIRFSSRRVSPEDQLLIDSLPLFTFDSVNGRNSSSGGDCAVCLSKFEPHDQLRLLPICCHAFHVQCVDTWLQSNKTCPLCRSPIHASESDILNKVLSTSAIGDSFRIEIGNISRRQALSDSGEVRRSYSIGSFDYVVDDESEVSVMYTHVRGVSDFTCVEKDESDAQSTEPAPGPSLAAEVGAGRSWLKEYVDRLSVSLSSGARSFRSSGRFFTGSSRRTEISGAGEWDLEANRIGEEISELFRWFSGV